MVHIWIAVHSNQTVFSEEPTDAIVASLHRVFEPEFSSGLASVLARLGQAPSLISLPLLIRTGSKDSSRHEPYSRQ